MSIWRLAVGFSLLAGAASAQAVIPCNDLSWAARADALVEPWEDYSATFANGAVRVALLDTIEPAAGAFYLLVLSPPYDELGGRQCNIVGFGESIGFANLAFETLTSDYVPGQGLRVSLVGRLYLPEEEFTNGLKLNLTINQATGDVIATTELGIE